VKSFRRSIMKDRILSLMGVSLHEAALYSAVLGSVLYLAGDEPAVSRSDGHPAGCHLCTITPRGAAAARDDYLLKYGAIERVDPLELDQTP
jgi:hypothetical protein